VSVRLPEGIKEIPHNMFEGCTSLTSFTIPDSVTKIWDDAFNRSGLESITIPDTVMEIGAFAFYGCENLVTVTISPVEGRKWLESYGFFAQFGKCSKLSLASQAALRNAGSPDKF